MIKVPSIILPDYFVRILKNYIAAPEQALKTFKNLWPDEKIREGVLGNIFYEISEGGDYKVILKSLGWIGTRDRLAAGFIYRAKHGVFPARPDLRLIDPILKWEEKAREYTTAGHSRNFLHAFYLEMAKTLHPEMEGVIDFDYSVLEYLHLAKSKMVMIDWAVLMIYHFKRYLGERTLRSVFEDGMEFDDICSFLSEEQRTQMFENLLSYGYSIDDGEIFRGDLV